MKCACGGKTEVVDVRPESGEPQIVRRRRECLTCKQRITTLEIPLDKPEPKKIMKPKEDKAKPIKNNREQVKKNQTARRRLEEIRDEEFAHEMDDILEEINYTSRGFKADWGE